MILGEPGERGDGAEGAKDSDLAELGRITGVGTRKLEAYGDGFLTVLKRSQEEKGDVSHP